MSYDLLTKGAHGGRSFSRGALYALLQNRFYRGEIGYKGDVYPGEHEAIVDERLWDAVQATLAANRVDRATGARTKTPSLLAGMVFDETGERLTPTHAVKKGARYRYYVSTSLMTGAGQKRSGRRIPAGDLERTVIDRLRTFFGDPGAVLDALASAARGGDPHAPSAPSEATHAQMIAHTRQLADDLLPRQSRGGADQYPPFAPRPVPAAFRSKRFDCPRCSGGRIGRYSRSDCARAPRAGRTRRPPPRRWRRPRALAQSEPSSHARPRP